MLKSRLTQQVQKGLTFCISNELPGDATAESETKCQGAKVLKPWAVLGALMFL